MNNSNDWISNKKVYTREQYASVYLKSRHWKNVQRSLYAIHKRCQLCKRSSELNIHHLSYERLGHEEPGDLIVLCKHCHIEVVHKALVSKKELERIAGYQRAAKQVVLQTPKGMGKKRHRKWKYEQRRKQFKPAPRVPLTPEEVDKRLLRKIGAIAYYRMKRSQVA
jgi:hypothetical protein